MSVRYSISKETVYQNTYFYTELVNTVLAGFVDVTPAIVAAFEVILESIRETI